MGFGVGLPKVIDAPASVSAGDLPKLPDRLDDRMIGLSVITGKDAGRTDAADASAIEQVAKKGAVGDADASSNLSSLYGAAEVRAYVDAKAAGSANATSAPAQVAVTIVPGTTGLVSPSGPFSIDTQGSHYSLKEIKGYRCAVAYQEPYDRTTGQPTGGEVPASNYQVECRTERGGLSYDAYASGLTPDETAAYLTKVLDLTAKG